MVKIEEQGHRVMADSILELGGRTLVLLHASPVIRAVLRFAHLCRI